MNEAKTFITPGPETFTHEGASELRVIATPYEDYWDFEIRDVPLTPSNRGAFIYNPGLLQARSVGELRDRLKLVAEALDKPVLILRPAHLEESGSTK